MTLPGQYLAVKMKFSGLYQLYFSMTEFESMWCLQKQDTMKFQSVSKTNDNNLYCFTEESMVHHWLPTPREITHTSHWLLYLIAYSVWERQLQGNSIYTPFIYTYVCILESFYSRRFQYGIFQRSLASIISPHTFSSFLPSHFLLSLSLPVLFWSFPPSYHPHSIPIFFNSPPWLQLKHTPLRIQS